MLLWIGYSRTGHHKVEVVVVVMVAEPPQAPQYKGGVTAKHTSAHTREQCAPMTLIQYTLQRWHPC